MVKFQGIIGPRILESPSFAGRPAQTEQEKYELDLNKVKHIMKTVTGKPIRDSHGIQNIGKIHRNWVTKDMQWWVELEIHNPEDGIDYVDLVRRGVLGNLSLQHMSKSLVATEVSLCKEGMREGSRIMYEICDNPEECGSKGDFYKPSSEDILISAAKEKDAIIIEMSSSSAASSKDEKLDMPPEFADLLDEDGKKQPKASGSGSAAPAPVDRGEDLSMGAGLPPAPPPRSAPIPNKQPIPVPSQPKGAAAPSKPAASAPLANKPQAAPPPPKPAAAAAAAMDDSDEGVPSQPATDAADAEEEVKKQQAALDKVMFDPRVSTEDRKRIQKHNLRTELTINQLKAQLEAEKKERERLEKFRDRVNSSVSNGKRELADTFGNVMAARGASKDQVEGIKKWFNDHADPLVEMGGEQLVSACRTFGDQVEHGEEFDEMQNRQRMIEHARKGGTMDTFQEEPRKPRPQVKARRHGLTSESGRESTPPAVPEGKDTKMPAAGAAAPEDDTKAYDEVPEDTPDEKISAARIGVEPPRYWEPPVSRGWRAEGAVGIPVDILALLRSQRDTPLEFKTTEAMVALVQGSKRTHSGAPAGYSGVM